MRPLVLFILALVSVGLIAYGSAQYALDHVQHPGTCQTR